MPTRPIFSVIMPCYMMGEFIGEALESVSAQTCREWEVIVVDDCAPDDGTEEIVKDFAKSNPNHRIEFIRHEKNTGVSGARNTALAEATGEWVAFLDPDDIWLPDHLSSAIQAFSSGSDIAIFSGSAQWFSDNHPDLNDADNRIAGWKIDYFPASIAINNFMTLSATVVRRKSIDAVGLFDTSPDLQHIEDYDLWIRLIEQREQFVFSEAVTCRYRRHALQASNDSAKMSQLHNALQDKHNYFFHQMRGRLIEKAFQEIASTRLALKNPIHWLLKRAKEVSVKLFR